MKHAKWRLKLNETFGNECYYCGIEGDRPEDWNWDEETQSWYYIGRRQHLVREHMLPKSRGGSNGAENIVPACPPCNKSKGVKTVEEWTRPDWEALV